MTIDELIDKAIEESGFVSTLVADRIIDEVPRDELAEWLLDRAKAILTEEISYRARKRRSGLVRSERRGAFADAAEAHENGDSSALTAFDAFYVVNETNTQKPLGELVVEECRFVADRYRDRAKANAFEAAVMDQVAKRVAAAGKGKFYTVNDDGYVFLLEARRGLDGWELVDVFDRYNDAHPEACYEITLGEFDTLDELVRHLEDEAA